MITHHHPKTSQQLREEHAQDIQCCEECAEHVRCGVFADGCAACDLIKLTKGQEFAKKHGLLSSP
jgi:hypothetical protein